MSIPLKHINARLGPNEISFKRRTMTAGRSYHAPFKSQYRHGEQEGFPEGKYVYYCALCLEAGLELNPGIKPLLIDAVLALNSQEIGVFDRGLNEAFRNLAKNTRTLDTNKNAIAVILDNLDSAPSFAHYQDCVRKLVLHSFNHDYRAPTITLENSPYLALAISMWTALIYKDTSFAELDIRRMGDDYWVMQDKTDDIGNRPDKERRNRMKAIARQYGLHIIHEATLYELAKLWYFADVIKGNLTVASGLGDCNGIAIPVFAHAGTAYNRIREFRLAMKPTI